MRFVFLILAFLMFAVNGIGQDDRSSWSNKVVAMTIVANIESRDWYPSFVGSFYVPRHMVSPIWAPEEIQEGYGIFMATQAHMLDVARVDAELALIPIKSLTYSPFLCIRVFSAKVRSVDPAAWETGDIRGIIRAWKSGPYFLDYSPEMEQYLIRCDAWEEVVRFQLGLN